MGLFDANVQSAMFAQMKKAQGETNERLDAILEQLQILNESLDELFKERV